MTVPSHQDFFGAALIALAARISKKTVHRRAAREGWRRRQDGNAFVYQVPRALLGKCLALAGESGPRGLSGETVTPERRAEALRIVHRLLACLLLGSAIEAGSPHESSLNRVARVASFRCSPRSLRRWFKAFAARGTAGLAERKRGRVGRKPNVKGRS